MGSQEGRKAGVGGVRLFAGAVILMVVAAVAGALYLSGSPASERARKLDNQRISDLQGITYAVDSYYAASAHVPTTIDELTMDGSTKYYAGRVTDSATGAPYEYVRTGDSTYQLCATFDLPSDDTAAQQMPYAPYPEAIGPDWKHTAGHGCFDVDASLRVPRTSCGLTTPCGAGQSCVTLSDGKGPVCVPAGKECLAAGCAADKCVVAESYPAQVRCTP